MIRRLFRACVSQHVLYKLADDQLHFYPELLAPIYYRHAAFHQFFLQEVAPAFDILEQTYVLRLHRGQYMRAYAITDRGLTFAGRPRDLISYVEHSLRMNEYWGEVVPVP